MKSKLKGLKSVGSDALEEAISILPDMAGLLSPEIVTDPNVVIAKVGISILTNKLRKFAEEFIAKKDSGKIRDDMDSIQDSTQEILRILKESTNDEEKLKAAKKLFFASVAPGTSESEQVVLFELLQTCRKLSGKEILTLKASFEIFQKGTNSIPGYDQVARFGDRGHWFKTVAHQLGHNLSSLIESTEENLIQEKLISGKTQPDNSGFSPPGQFRLTDYGVKFCEYLASESQEN